MERKQTGTFVTSTYGEEAPAFVPAKLPPSPELKYPGSLVATLNDTNHLLGEINQTIKEIPFHKKFVAMYVRYEASRSSEIEGIETTVDEILDFEISEASDVDPDRQDRDIFTQEKIKDLQEVDNYIEAIYTGFDRMREIPVSSRLLKELHRVLMEGSVRGGNKRPGEFRTTQNYIGDPDLGPQEAEHIPPPPREIDDLISNLCEFINTDESPVLVKTGLAHVQFETIHPFLDGNGRLGRLLVPLILKQEAVCEHPVFYLSEYFKNNQKQYFECLTDARYSGDWENWNEFYLEGLNSTAHRVSKTIQRTIDLYEDDRESLDSKYRWTDNLSEAFEQLYARPKFTVTQLSEEIDVSYNAAAEIVSKFNESDMVKEITGRERGKVYSYERYMDIFRTIERERTSSAGLAEKRKERFEQERDKPD